MMTIVILATAMAAPPSLWPMHSEIKGGDLFELLSGSEICAVATITEATPVARRSKPRSRPITDLSATVGGTLFAMRIDEHLCSRSDLASHDSTGIENRPAEVYMFWKRGDEGYFGESAPLLNQRYLIFAKPAADQDELFERSQLNSSMVGEQAFQGRIYRLHDDRPPMLRMTRDFCQAVGPPEVAEKLSRLKSLLQSEASDEGLKASVLKAIAAIEERLRSNPSGG